MIHIPGKVTGYCNYEKTQKNIIIKKSLINLFLFFHQAFLYKSPSINLLRFLFVINVEVFFSRVITLLPIKSERWKENRDTLENSSD